MLSLNETAGTRGRHVSLRPIMPEDLDFLYLLFTDPETGFRWRLRGSTPPRAVFEQALWEQVHAQFLIVSNKQGARAGIATCYAADLHSGHAHVGFTFSPPFQNSGILGEVAIILLDFIFERWPFRKLYFQMPEFIFAEHQRGIGRYLAEEARLAEHHYFDGRYWESVVLSVSASAWREVSQKLRRADAFQP